MKLALENVSHGKLNKKKAEISIGDSRILYCKIARLKLVICLHL